MIDTLIFDLDGTLLDTSDGIWKSVIDTVNHFSMEPINSDQMSKFIGPPIIESFRDYYGISDEKSREMMYYFRNNYVDCHLFEAKPYPEIDVVLENLAKNYKLYVATNKREDYANTILQYFDLKKYFKSIHGTDYDNKLSKTDLISLCMDEASSTKGSTVMIGDTIGDKKSAEQMGVKFIGVGYGFGNMGGTGIVRLPSDIPLAIMEIDY